MKVRFAIAAASLLAGAAGLALYSKITRDSESPTAQSSPANDAAITATASPSTSIPTVLPDIQLKNRDGDMQSLRSWPNKSMIVNFWATWCGPCRKEIPLLKEIAKNESAFQVVGIAIDFREDVLKYADEIKIDYPLLIGEQDGLAAADAFGMNSPGLPFTAFTDNKGRMVVMLMGELTKKKAEVILNGVKRVNAGELTPEAARSAITVKLAAIKT